MTTTRSGDGRGRVAQKFQPGQTTGASGKAQVQDMDHGQDGAKGLWNAVVALARTPKKTRKCQFFYNVGGLRTRESL